MTLPQRRTLSGRREKVSRVSVVRTHVVDQVFSHFEALPFVPILFEQISMLDRSVAQVIARMELMVQPIHRVIVQHVADLCDLGKLMEI
jgi:hypothetical protein